MDMVRGRVRAAACALAAAGILIAAQRAEAIRPDLSIEQIRDTAWRMNEGAPQDVWAMTQTSDGWLWFGGSHGLYRFDGVTFEKVDPQPESPNRSDGISELVALDSGGMVIGYHSGGVGIMRNGVVKNYYEADGLDASTTFSIATGIDGAIWVATRNGVYRFDGVRWNRVGQDWGLPAQRPVDIHFDRHGTLWMSFSDRLVYLEPGARKFQPGPAVQDGAFFVERPDGRLDYLDLLGIHECPGQHPLTASAASAVPRLLRSGPALVDRSGSYWVMGENALVRFASASEVPAYMQLDKPAQASRGVAVRHPKSAMEDRDGNIWVVTIADGLLRLHDSTFTRVPLPPQFEGLLTGLAIGDDGIVWTTQRSGPVAINPLDGLYRFDRKYTKVQADEIRTGGILHRGDDGVIRVAGEHDLWRNGGKAFTKDAALPMVNLAHPVIGIASRASPQALWITVLGRGLYRREGSEWLRNGGVPGLPDIEASTLVFDGSGRLWLGYADDGVISVENGRATRIAFDRAPTLGTIRSISVGRRVIVGGERGLALLEGGRLRALVPDDATAFSLVTGIVQVRNGDVWLNTATGARRISAAALDAAAKDPLGRVAAGLFARADGYPGPGTDTGPFGPSAVTALDGRIWFHGQEGLAWVDPIKIDGGHQPIRLAIRYVQTDSINVEPHGSLHLAAGTNKIAVAYSSLNFAHAGEQRFRYRLKGLDDTWTDVGTRREAFFTNLGPGQYRFELLGEDERGDWTPTPIAVDFDIAPTFLQSKIFFALCVLAALLLATWAIRLRVRQLAARERAKLDERYRERERIARELHDTLLQSAQGVVMLVEGATTRLPSGDPLRQPLERAAAVGRAGITEGRDRIRELSASNRPSAELLASLGELAGELSRSSGITHAVRIEGAPRALKAAAADEVLLIAREALLNAFRHSQASHVQLVQTYADDAFTIEVADDGRGIPAQVLSAGGVQDHWGLPGMRTRAERLGAAFDIASRPGLGTRVTLRLPAELAYDRPASRRWYALLRA